MKKILFLILVFSIIGELMIRLDQSLLILEENRVVKISTDIENTEEYQLLKNQELPINENDLRIMVIGDSYIHGGGINFEDNFSQQLKKMFKNNTHNFNKVWVLDITKPSSNNLDNNLLYFEYANKFKPNIVVLGYNFNDIEGNLTKKTASTNTPQVHGKSSQSLVSKIYATVKQSRLIGFMMNKIHRRVNSFGFIIPGSKFDENLKIYYQNKDAWEKSKTLLNEVIIDSKNRSTHLIVYKFQDMSVNPNIMIKSNEVINEFFQQYPDITFLDGNDIFKSTDFKKYQLSKYDGHPNEKAHLIMAEEIYTIMNTKLLISSE